MKIVNKFSRNQKVWCYYYSTRFFNPPMCGTILSKYPLLKKHHFAFKCKGYKSNKCHWYFIQMENGQIVLMPETCINDLYEEIKQFNNVMPHLYPDEKKQTDTWLKLKQIQMKRYAFLQKNEIGENLRP